MLPNSPSGAVGIVDPIDGMANFAAVTIGVPWGARTTLIERKCMWDGGSYLSRVVGGRRR